MVEVGPDVFAPTTYNYGRKGQSSDFVCRYRRREDCRVKTAVKAGLIGNYARRGQARVVCKSPPSFSPILG